MDLMKNGELLRRLRKEKSLTQKELADRLGIVAKTVSKWETGNGFPDVSMLPVLADIFGVNERSLLTGDLTENKTESGNPKRTRFYVCPHCGSMMQGTGGCHVVCCGKTLLPLKASPADSEHALKITEVENEFYVELDHEMTKAHYVRFVTYVGFDRVLTMHLYPEQDPAVRIPKIYDGKIVYYCNCDGLFEYPLRQLRKR